jgi:ribonuclease HI
VSTPAFTICHLETDASLNDKRFKTLEDGSTLKFAGGGVVLRTVAMRPIAYFPVPLGFVRNSEEAECRALLEGIRIAKKLGAKAIMGRSDHLHLVEFAGGRYEFRTPDLIALGQEIRAEAATLTGFMLRWSPSYHNRTRGDGVPAADFLARQAAGLGIRKNRPRRHRRRLGST